MDVKIWTSQLFLIFHKISFFLDQSVSAVSEIFCTLFIPLPPFHLNKYPKILQSFVPNFINDSSLLAKREA